MQIFTGSTSCDDRATRGNDKGKIMVNLKENAREEEEIKRLNQELVQRGKPPHYDLEKAKENILWESCLTKEEAFEQVFGEAMEEFNSKQKRTDRKTTMEKEFAKLDKGKVKQELIHSMIVQVGNEHEAPSKGECIDILKEYLKEFRKRFPNMRIVSCAIHLDEATPHLQLYFIPVKTKEQHLAQGNTKKWSGMDVQPSLSGALEQMGYTNDATKEVEVDGEKKIVKDYENCAIAQWQKDFNGLLDEICLNHDIEINHYMKGKKVSHQDTLDYKDGKLQEAINEKKEELITVEFATQEAKETLNKTQNKVDTLQDKVNVLNNELNALEGQIKTFKGMLEQIVDRFENLLNRFKNRHWEDLFKQRKTDAAIRSGSKEKETIEDYLRDNDLAREMPTQSIERFMGATSKLEELDEEWKDWERF